ncbi:MAG: hypothetical protein ABH824_03520, partial [Nanoarchaeota archaeon]
MKLITKNNFLRLIFIFLIINLTFSAFAEGFLQKNDVPLESLALGTAAISPSSGTVQNGNEFTVEIIA